MRIGLKAKSTRVKTFVSAYSNEELVNNVNEFLANNPGVEVVDMTFKIVQHGYQNGVIHHYAIVVYSDY